MPCCEGKDVPILRRLATPKTGYASITMDELRRNTDSANCLSICKVTVSKSSAMFAKR